MLTLTPLGDRGFLARFPNEDQARQWAHSLRSEGWLGIVDIVPAYASVAVMADPDAINIHTLDDRLRSFVPDEHIDSQGKCIDVPALYDGVDLADAAGKLGLSVLDTIALHASVDFRVQAIGFLPGFPYAGELPQKLRGLARRTSPRTHVAGGSIAIAGSQTAIYPQDSPGGWHIIARTPLRIIDLEHNHFPIQTGDRLRFVRIEKQEYHARYGELLA